MNKMNDDYISRVVRPWSYSKASSAIRCPLMFYWGYFSKRMQDPNSTSQATTKGSAIHDIFDFFFNEKIPLDECIQKSINKHSQLTKKSNKYVKGLSLSYSTFINRVIECLRSGPDMTIYIESELAITHTFEPTDYSNKFGYFRGKVDVLIIDNSNKTGHIIDHKTGKTDIVSYYADQLEFYALLVMEKYHLDSIKTSIHFPHLQKISPILPGITKETKGSARDNLSKFLKEAHDNIREDDKVCTPNSMCRYCKFKFSCLNRIKTKDGLTVEGDPNIVRKATHY